MSQQDCWLVPGAVTAAAQAPGPPNPGQGFVSKAGFLCPSWFLCPLGLCILLVFILPLQKASSLESSQA